MENHHCNRCGEEYSSTYRKCPFCQEAAAERRGRPIYRRGKRLDLRQRSAGAGGVIKMVILSVALVVVGLVVFGDNIAGFLGIRTQNSLVQQDDPISTAPVTGENTQSGAGSEDASQSGENTGTGENAGGEADASQAESVPLAIDQTSITIPSGETARITATGGSGEIVWTSSNDEIATVNGGSVTGVAGGTVTITATTGSETVTCTVTVTGDPWVSPVQLSLNREDFTLSE